MIYFVEKQFACHLLKQKCILYTFPEGEEQQKGKKSIGNARCNFLLTNIKTKKKLD